MERNAERIEKRKESKKEREWNGKGRLRVSETKEKWKGKG